MQRRHLLAAALAATVGLGAALPAQAQDAWPSKPIRIIVPFAAGGTSDVLARTIGEKLRGALNQTVLIENRAGAGGVIGADLVARADADGHTILLGTIASHAINPALRSDMPYDAVKDFAPIILVGSIANVMLTNAKQPFKSVKDVIEDARKRPGALSFASAGQGSSQHMSGENFKLLTGVDMTHVPYRGSAPAIQDLIGDQIPLSFETALVALPHIQAGTVRALAVTSGTRTHVLPDTPTLQEAGVPDFDVASWQAFFAPGKTPPAVVERLNKEIQAIIAQPETAAKLKELGVSYQPNSPAEFAAFQKAELEKWRNVVQKANLKLQ